MKYTPGLLAGQLSGKAGSTVASRNAWGSYFRTKVSPTNPSTIDQQELRSNFQALAALWRLLTDAQRALWTAFGAAVIRTDSLGNNYSLSGIQAYIMVNANGKTLGVGTGELTPVPLGNAPATNLASVTLSSAAGAVSLALSPSPTPADTDIAIFATAPLSAGKNFFGNVQPGARKAKGEYRLIQVIPGSTITPVVLTTAYVAKFGAPPAGMKLSVQALPINNTSFLSGTPIRDDAIAT